MEELNNTELYILVSLETKGIFQVNEASIICDLDKTSCYKAMKNLEKNNLLIKIDSKPLKFAINYDKINGII